jgi:hypothetical protein
MGIMLAYDITDPKSFENLQVCGAMRLDAARNKLQARSCCTAMQHNSA